MKILFAFILFTSCLFASGGACPANLPVTGNNCYFIAASGSDTNNGTTESTPWAHAPGMPNCANNCAAFPSSATLANGIGWIFKGGDTWHFGNSGATPYTGGTWTEFWGAGCQNGSGSGCGTTVTNCDMTDNPNLSSANNTGCFYIGVDKTWFTGGSWTRPILTGDNPTSTSAVGSCTYGNVGSKNTFIEVNNNAGLWLDNFEFTGMCVATASSSGNNYLNAWNYYIYEDGAVNGTSQNRYSNLYAHGGTHLAFSCMDVSGNPVGACGSPTFMNGGGMSVLGPGNVCDGWDMDPTGFGCLAFGPAYIVYDNVFANQAQVVVNGYHDWHDNQSFGFTFTGNGVAHGNQFESNVDAPTGAQTSVPFNVFYNNIWGHNTTGAGGSVMLWFCSNATAAEYHFNNTVYDQSSGNNYDIAQAGFNCTTSNAGIYLFNNTFDIPGSNTLNCAVNLTATNNHIVVDSGTGFPAGSCTINNSTVMSHATAVSQGYMATGRGTSGNNSNVTCANDTTPCAPTSGANSTVGAGTNLTSSYCNTLAGSSAAEIARAGVACKAGTTDSCVYNTGSRTVTCPREIAVARPTSTAWDTGAYEFAGTPSCTVTSPVFGMVYTSPQAIPLSISVSNAPTAYDARYSVSYRRWADAYAIPQNQNPLELWEHWQSPFTSLWYTGLNGDGQHLVQAAIYDIFGNVLANCTGSLFTIRIEGMSAQTISPAVPSGSGALGLLTFDGTPAASSANASLSIDGFPVQQTCGGADITSQTGGWSTPDFSTIGKSNCIGFTNGQHLLTLGYYIGGIADPYLLSLPFTSSGTAISTGSSNHYSTTGSVVTVSNTGGSLPTPLVKGFQCEEQSSATTSCTVSGFSVSGGVINVTTSIGTSATTGTPVYVRNIRSTNQNTGATNCDGYYLAASGTTTSSINITAPASCPNGVTQSNEFELIVNPYFVTYTDATHFTISATPGGSAISLGSCSGTCNVQQRIRSPYWGGNKDFASSGAQAYQQVLATFNNNAAPMLIHPKYWEVPLVAGGSTISICDPATLIQNADLTFTNTNCNASGISWTPSDDGGLTNSSVATLSTSSSAVTVTPVGAGWMTITVACASCATGSVSLSSQVIHIHVFSSSVTFPHFTTCGVVAQAYNSGLPMGCNSFFPLSVWNASIIYSTTWNTNANARAGWLGPSFQHSGFNASTTGPQTDGLSSVTGSSCPNPASGTNTYNYEEGFASTFGIYLENDINGYVFGPSGTSLASLAAILNNTGFPRHTCIQNVYSHFVTIGRYFRLYLDDENTFVLGSIFQPAPTIGSANFAKVTVSGGVATFTTLLSIQIPWVQSTGLGTWMQVTGATNTCLNGWYPLNTVTLGGFNNGYTLAFTAPTTCGNGTYEPVGGITETTAQLVVNPSPLNTPPYMANPNNQQNISGLPGDLSVQATAWIGAAGQAISAIAVSSCAGSITWPSNNLTSGVAIRIWHGTTANINTLAVVTSSSGANPVTFNYANQTGSACPANGNYTSATDPNLYITVDPNWGANPLGQLYSLINGVSNVPTQAAGMLGSFFLSTANSAAISSYQNTPNSPTAWLYNGNPSGFPFYGTDTSVQQAMVVSQNGSGILTRAWQTYPRAMLWSAGLDATRYCESYVFNPACDHPSLLNWRRETLLTQVEGMNVLGISAFRLYNYDNNMPNDYANCCGWNAPPGGTGLGPAINPFVSANQYQAATLINAELTQDQRWSLQPECPKPFIDGRFFITDCHTGANGNILKVVGGDEQPYGPFTLNTGAIAGGTLLQKTLDGYTETVQVVPGNPSTLTQEWAPTPGTTTVLIAEPPGIHYEDTITFPAPTSLPYGATKYLVRVSYSYYDMIHNPAVDCTSGCSIVVDHSTYPAYYQSIYANNNGIPVGPPNPDPTPIVSQARP